MINNAIFSLLLFIFYFILMISYNIFNINKKNVDSMYEDKRKEKLKKIFLEELRRENRKKYSHKIFKYLLKSSYLLLFNNMLLNNEKLDEKFSCIDVINNFEDTFNSLSIHYKKKNRLSKSYYAYSLSLYSLVNNASYSFLFDVITGNDFEGIHNAFNTICIYGKLDKLIAAINILNNRETEFNLELISCFLLRYSGDKIELSNTLLERFEGYNINLKIAIIKYFIAIKFDCSVSLSNLLKRKNTSRELLLELIRYFKICNYDGVKEFLYDIVESSSDVEKVIVSIDTLSAYPDSKTYSILKSKIKNKDYLVSYQAVRSLLILDGYDETSDSFEDTILRSLEYVKDKG